MADIDTDRLIAIVTGIQLKAELGDRPLAYRIEQAVREHLAAALPKPSPASCRASRRPSSATSTTSTATSSRPARRSASAARGMNAVSATLVEKLPTAVAIENTLVIQMDLEGDDPRCAVWGMNHLDTVRAVETFLAKGYLETFLQGIIEREQVE
jgi:hypothetical protein